MDTIKQEKIQRFLDDKIMSMAVYDVLLEELLRKRHGADVNIVAASMLAVYALDDAWRELTKYKKQGTYQKKELDQVGL